MDHKPNHPASSAAAQGSAHANGEQTALALKADASGARELTREVRGIVDDVAGQARKTAEEQLAGGKERAVEGLENVADVLRHAGEHLREKEANALPGYIVQAADQVDSLARYLHKRTLGQVLGDVERYARREPALFLGGAFLLGLLGGRFLKSSRPRPTIAAREQRSQGNHEPQHASQARGSSTASPGGLPALPRGGKPHEEAVFHGPVPAGADGTKPNGEATTRPPGAA